MNMFFEFVIRELRRNILKFSVSASRSGGYTYIVHTACVLLRVITHIILDCNKDANAEQKKILKENF